AKLAHSLRVMARVRGALARTVAALHDVLETTPLALDDLRRLGFSDAVVRRVDLLTRRPRERYFDYIRRLEGDSVARRVKLADLDDNATRLRAAAARSVRARRKLKRNRAARRRLLRLGP
ncbi:MAG: GTP pyrophosphokinase, partial [Kiritimatiellae bacterium]|nr:GTP pyrophosphokinase [Kiritimatiellia bacterium]